MRIVQWIDAWDRTRGGPVSVAESLSRLMRSGGHETTIATLRIAEPSRLEADEIGVVEIDSGPMQTIARRGTAMLTRLLERADCLHIHGIWEPSGVQAARIADRLGVRHVVSLHGMLDDWAMSQRSLRKRIFLNCFARSMLQAASAVHCASAGEARQAASRIPGATLLQIPQPIDFEGLPVADPANAEPTVLMLGRLHPVKGPEVAIDALARVRRSGRTIRLAMGGTGDPGYLQSLQERARDRGVADLVDWLGQLDRSRRAQTIARSMAAVAPTIQENFGMALFEVLASGLPLVVSETIDTRDELIESRGAMVVTRDVESFARSMEELHDDPGLRRRLGEWGRAWTIEWLQPTRLRACYEAIYRGETSSR